MWVIFEGLDKAGKGTLEWEFLKATNFKHIIVDRGPAGYVTFDTLFDRLTQDNKNAHGRSLALMRACTDEFLVVYCKVRADIAMQRIEEHNETCPYNYENAQELYDNAIEILYKNNGIKVVTVNTEKSIQECVDFIVDSL